MRDERWAREAVRYAQVRSLAYRSAEDDLRTDLGLSTTLTSIDRNALSRWKADWQSPPSRPRTSGGWNWEGLSASYIRKPDALHLAIWAEGVLCGLVVGKPNANRSRLAIHYLEGTPQQNNPLRGKVVLVTLAAATRYAQALEIPLLRVRNPVLSMETWLKRAGFVLAEESVGPRYWERRTP